MLLNLGHIDMDFEVLYVVDNSYCLTDFPVVFGDVDIAEAFKAAPIK